MCASALAIWEKAGYKADFVFDHWLAKVPREMFVDVIDRSRATCSGTVDGQTVDVGTPWTDG